jgi:hypothetical protein
MKHLIRFCLGASVALTMGFGAGQLMAPASVSAAAGSNCPQMLCSTGGDCVPGHHTQYVYCGWDGPPGTPWCFTGECDEDPPCENPWECEEDPDGGGSSGS